MKKGLAGHRQLRSPHQNQEHYHFPLHLTSSHISHSSLLHPLQPLLQPGQITRPRPLIHVQDVEACLGHSGCVHLPSRTRVCDIRYSPRRLLMVPRVYAMLIAQDL